MSFSIVFDYRFDPSGFYDDPEVRAVMERAAEIWSDIIKDEFDDVRAGTTFSISNPSLVNQRETVVLTEDIDDLLIFAGARDLASLGRGGFAGTDAQGDIFRARVSNDFRDTGPVSDFEPWAGLITLDLRDDWSTDLDGPVAGKNDMLTTVLHEIGHILGIGTAPAFHALVDGHEFTGTNTLAANGGAAVPLAHGDSHVEDGFDDGEVLLDPVTLTGTRKMPGAIDRAMLADIGYEIDGYTTQGSTPPLATQASEKLYGTMLDDHIESLSGDDQVQGGAGNDTILAGSGDDLVFGQDGNDVIDGGAGADQLQGNAGDDTVNGGLGSDTLFGQDGDDLLFGGSGADFLLGGSGNDTLRGGAGDDSIRTGSGTDRIMLEEAMGIDTVYDFEFGRDVIDTSLLAHGTGVTVSGSGTQRVLTLDDGGKIYLQGSIADVTAGVTLTGQAVQNATLTASLTGISDLFGTPAEASRYSWLRDGVVIEGATGSSYVLVQDDVGAAISVHAEYTSGSGLSQVTGAPTAAVANINDLPTGGITLEGTPVSGATLEIDITALDDPDGLGRPGYQWLRDGTPIEGATAAQYMLGAADTGTGITAVVHYTDGHGTLETVTSAPLIPQPDPSSGRSLAEEITGPEVVVVALLRGDAGNNLLQAGDTGGAIYGGGGTDTLIGGAGNDLLVGGEDAADLRDVIYGGAGDDTINGGYGNDELRGDAGNDVISGGFGADLVIGGTGDDTLTGSALGDMLFGGDGDDFINGGFGYDLVNGGAGADRFFHLGIADHGSDWIQDYTSAQGDTLVFGNTDATAEQFQINSAFTAGAGDADTADAFVIYKPEGRIIWALIDGMAQDEINLTIDGQTFDLLI
ncbi:hypothetical protein OS189_16850 [Sulfitobacter sp. F26169L]|uniref:hypothetical protein n=1 Tax=Sulfitobacter sp. F26169L TaxID=2996015 RepID=UPI002260FF54|nr:hypothetical protein [Sulfitobacter sp. F26169L]MCX7568013.1 hypothetical protein [Sulfitobacter sp. F26169L]